MTGGGAGGDGGLTWWGWRFTGIYDMPCPLNLAPPSRSAYAMAREWGTDRLLPLPPLLLRAPTMSGMAAARSCSCCTFMLRGACLPGGTSTEPAGLNSIGFSYILQKDKRRDRQRQMKNRGFRYLKDTHRPKQALWEAVAQWAKALYHYSRDDFDSRLVPVSSLFSPAQSPALKIAKTKATKLLK